MVVTEEAKSKVEALEYELVNLCKEIQGVVDDLKVVKTTALKDAAYNVVEDIVENIRRKMDHYKQEFYRELDASSREIFKTELARDTAAVAFDIMVFTTAFLNRKADWQSSHPSPEYFIHYDKKDIEKLEI